MNNEFKNIIGGIPQGSHFGPNNNFIHITKYEMFFNFQFIKKI